MAVAVAAAVASGALADTGAPTETTPTPTVTTPDPSVTVPDPGPPVELVPKPDPGPVKRVPKPQPHVVHRTAPVTPAVVHSVYRAPATPAVVVQPSLPAAKPKAKPRATPNHVAAQRKHLAKPKHRPTQRRVTKPRPAAVKPRSQGPAITLQHESARSSGGWAGIAWGNIAIVAGLALLLLSAVLVATRRALRTSPGDEVASNVGLTSARGSRPAPDDEELLPTQPVLGTSPGVEIPPDVGLTSANGSSPALHDEELLPLPERDQAQDRSLFLELELKAHAERADELAAELALFHAREELIRETLVTAQKTANELRDSASATLRKARRRADRIVEQAERRRTRLEAELQGLERLAVEDRAEVATLLQSLLEQIAASGEPGGPGGERASPLPEPHRERFDPGDYVRLTEPTLGMREGVPRELWEVPTSEIGQVVNHDAAADLVEVMFEHNSGDNGSHPIRLVVETAQLEGVEQPAADTPIAS